MKKMKAAFFIGMMFFSGAVFAADMTSSAVQPPKGTVKTKVDPEVAFVENLQALLDAGELDKAISSFDTMPKNLKRSSDLMLIKASLLISASRLEEASELINELEKNDPSNVSILEMKIAIAKAGGKSKQNVQAKKAAIAKVIALDPNNAAANIELAQEQVLLRKYKLAQNYYRKALIGSPDDAGALFGFGQTSYYLNKLDDARAAFEKMIALNPQEAIAYQYLGKLEAEKENYKPAFEYISKAILFDDKNPDFYMDLGTYSRFLGKFDGAEQAWTKAISLNPDDFLAYAYRAGLYDEQDKFDLALKDYRKVVETNPKYYFAYESLGILAWHEQQWDEARAAFEKAYSYNKENVSYPLMIAACYIKTNKLQQAKLFLEQVMKTKSDRTSIEYQMLRLFLDQGPSNAENDIALKIPKEEKSTTRGKMMYYFALYYEMKGIPNLAAKYYAEVKNMKSPMFFEYRLAEWSLEK